MNATKYIFLSLILYCFAINFSFANDNTLIISPENDTPSYQTNHQPEKIVIHSNKKTENANKIQFEDDNPNEEIINIEQNNHAKHESVPNRKTHSNIKKNDHIDIIENEVEITIASDSATENKATAITTLDGQEEITTLAAASTILNNASARSIDYEAKLIEFNVQDKTKEHMKNKNEINFNYNNLLYYLLYVFSLLFIFCFVGLIKEIIKRRKSKMKVAYNEKSN